MLQFTVLVVVRVISDGQIGWLLFLEVIVIEESSEIRFLKQPSNRNLESDSQTSNEYDGRTTMCQII